MFWKTLVFNSFKVFMQNLRGEKPFITTVLTERENWLSVRTYITLLKKKSFFLKTLDLLPSTDSFQHLMAFPLAHTKQIL